MLELKNKSLMLILLVCALALPFYQYGLWFDIILILTSIITHNIKNIYGKYKNSLSCY